MQHTDRCIGRDRELAQLRIGIGDGKDGLRLSMLTGPSGLGKTTLSRVAVAEAADRGFKVATALGRAGSLSTPFAPWREALPEFATLLAEAARPDATLDMESLGARFVALLTEICAKQPLLLVIDDAQALDESSLALLPWAVGVSDKLDLSILIVEQNDAVDVSASYRAFVDGLVARRVVRHLELGPMGDDSIVQLVRAVLELDEDTEIPTEIVLRSQGNPWFAQELAEAWRRGTSDIPVSIAAAATSRINGLEEAAQDLVYAIALGHDGAHIGWIEALSDVKPRQFVRMMEAIKASGLVREDGDVLTIAHPLMQQALLDELSAAMKRALHMEIVQAIESMSMNEVTSARALGYHMNQAGKPDEAVAHYVRAAAANSMLGQLHEALADFENALAAEPRIERRAELLQSCGNAAMLIGDERAFGYWTELGRITAARNDGAMTAFALYHQYWASTDGTAVDRLERAETLGSDEYGWSARAAGCLKTLDGDYAGAIVHDERALELSRETGDHMLEVVCLDKLSKSYLYVGDIDKSIEASRSAIQIATAKQLSGLAWTARHSLVELLAENLQTDEAFAEARSNQKFIDDLGLTRHRPIVAASLARAYMRRGELHKASSVMQEVADDPASPSHPWHGLVALTACELAVDLGDMIVGETAVSRAELVASERGYESWIFDGQLERFRLNTINGDIAAAIREAVKLRIDEPSSMAKLALYIGRIASMHDLAEGIEAATDICSRIKAGYPLSELAIEEVSAIREAFDGGDITALENVIAQWEAKGRKLDAARASLVRGVLLAKRGARDQSVVLLTEVRQRLATMGASQDADIAAAKLREMGSRSRAKTRSTNVGSLTRRELQIARLVASGLKNSEVAGQLFLAEKTVAAHLSNIYGKVEVKSRTQLASWLQENDSEAMAV